ncbi:hypothetical protein [Kosakonia sacchari]|uniref:hypothetical protein n=1 Tax=Kosakonia sacchari TaxID=1158459 RepID=UPI001585952D|nr:hypothetical protein [Kosakonia sacchari]NUL35104.1 hypothetical protein [Kosakonia sacchari]
MKIYGVTLKKSDNPYEVVKSLCEVCCLKGEGNNVAHLSGCEISKIYSRQNMWELPTQAAIIISQIYRLGLCFHVAQHKSHYGVFIAKNPEILLNAS